MLITTYKPGPLIFQKMLCGAILSKMEYFLPVLYSTQQFQKNTKEINGTNCIKYWKPQKDKKTNIWNIDLLKMVNGVLFQKKGSFAPML